LNDDDREEAWDEDGSDQDEETNETIVCPACGAEIYEESVQCPECEQYISPNTSAWANRPWWWVALGLLGVLAALWAITALG